MKKKCLLYAVCMSLLGCLSFKSDMSFQKSTQVIMQETCGYYHNGINYCVDVSASGGGSSGIAHAYVREEDSSNSQLVVCEYRGTVNNTQYHYEGVYRISSSYIMVIDVITDSGGTVINTYVNFYLDVG